MIEIKNLTFQYPTGSGFRLCIEDLTVKEGEKCVIVGPSGSGKTTLINIITGIYKPLRGRVTIHGNEISKKNDRLLRQFRLEHIGYIFQDFGLMEYLNVEHNILLPLYLNPRSEIQATVEKRLNTLLQRLGLAGKRKEAIDYLSQGEKQRVAIARSLINDPAIIIADEPTGSLDLRTTESIMELLMGVVGEGEKTLLFVTHDVSLRKYFDRVIDMASAAGTENDAGKTV